MRRPCNVSVLMFLYAYQVPTVIVQSRFISRLALPLCIGSMFLIGCGGSDGSKVKLPPLGTVHGVIKLDDKPLENAYVDFIPSGANPSTGQTNSSGAYTLDYGSSVKGAAIGEHAVQIKTKVGGAVGAGTVEKVPPKYNTKSELKATVKAGDNKIDFDLKSK